MAKLLEHTSDYSDVKVVMSRGLPYLVIIRKNGNVEIIENFISTIHVECVPKIKKLHHCFNDKQTLTFLDGSYA